MEYIEDGHIHKVLSDLKEGESIDAEGMSRHFGLPHLDMSLDIRLCGMVKRGSAAFDDWTSQQRWYIAGPKLTKKNEERGT